MVDLTKVVYLELWKERRQAEAKAAALEYKQHKDTPAQTFIAGTQIHTLTHMPTCSMFFMMKEFSL